VVGIASETLQLFLALGVLLILVVWCMGFAAGAFQCGGTGNAHLDAFVAYLRLHTIHRRAASELTGFFELVGLPLRLTSPDELLALTSAVGAVAVGVAGFYRQSRPSLMAI
jgi:hypothetical protein